MLLECVRGRGGRRGYSKNGDIYSKDVISRLRGSRVCRVSVGIENDHLEVKETVARPVDTIKTLLA